MLFTTPLAWAWPHPGRFAYISCWNPHIHPARQMPRILAGNWDGEEKGPSQEVAKLQDSTSGWADPSARVRPTMSGHWTTFCSQVSPHIQARRWGEGQPKVAAQKFNPAQTPSQGGRSRHERNTSSLCKYYLLSQYLPELAVLAVLRTDCLPGNFHIFIITSLRPGIPVAAQQ